MRDQICSLNVLLDTRNVFFKNQFNSTFRNEIVFLLGIFLSSFFIIRVPDIRERIQYRAEKKLRE